MEDTKKQFLDFLTEVKEFGKQLFTTAKPEKFSITLADGTEISSDTEPIAVGSAITVNTPEGPAPMPDGEYPVMVDGAEMLMVCAGGFVTELKPVEKAADAPAAEGEMNTDFAAAIKQLEEKFESRISAIESALSIAKKNEMSAQKELETFKAKFEKVGELNAKTLELIEKIGNETPEPITTKKRNETPEKTEIEKFREWQKEHKLI